MEKVKIKICDSAFAHSVSSSLDNIPKHITWVRDFNYNDDNDLVFFTDQNIFNFFNVKSKIKICWLLEPVSIFPQSYDFVKLHYSRPDFFDYILTYDKELIELNKNLDKEKFIWYPHGGSWIEKNDFKLYDKSKMCSIIASTKSQTSGHRMRQGVIDYYGKQMDIFGRGRKEIESKKEGLCDYRYSVVIENTNIQKGYFSEKIIDPFSTATIPLYWGPPIEEYFDKCGILEFSTVSQLGYILDNIIGEDHYNSRMSAIENNLELSKFYRVAEDWIWENWLKFKYKEFIKK